MLHALLYGPKNKYVSNFVGVFHSTSIIFHTLIKIHTTKISPTNGISPVTVSILWFLWLDTTVSLGPYQLPCTRVLVDSMAPMLLSGSSSISIPRCYRKTLYYLYHTEMKQFHVHCAPFSYFYYMAMAWILLCASCKILLLVFRGNGAGFPVFWAHLLLFFVHISVLILQNANFFRHYSDPLVLDPLLYLGTTSSWSLNILSWLLFQISVTSLIACILVWLYATSSHLYVHALVSLWYFHYWYLLSLCLSWLRLLIYVKIKLI